jgi:hypothetical protein
MRTEILTFTISLSTYLHSRAPPHHTAVRKPTQDHARTWIARSLFGFGDVRVGADDDDVRGDAFLARHVHLCNGHGSLHHTAEKFQNRRKTQPKPQEENREWVGLRII